MAREPHDRETPRSARGFFSARRQARRDRERDRERERAEFDEMSAIDGSETEFEHEVPRGRPRTGAKRSVMRVIQQIPAYLKLLMGLMRDARVSRIDRLLVVAAIAYIVSPFDFIPDFLPFLGEVDDIFLLMLALQRLIDHTGRRVLMDHWHGDPRDLSDVNLAGIVSAAGFFLPARLRRRLRGMARR